MIKWLFESAHHQDKNQQVKDLIALHFDEIHAFTDDNRCTLLHIAADCNLPLLGFLLTLYQEHELGDTSSWIDVSDANGNTPLHYAVFRNSLATVQLLERSGADRSKINRYGLTCLHLAAQADSPLLIHYFQQQGLDTPDLTGSTPLHWAAHFDLEHATAMLLSLGSDPNKQEHEGNTVLHLAANLGFSRISRRLILGGCDHRIENKSGKRAIDLAKEGEHFDIADMLREEFKLRDILLIRPPLKPTTPELYPVLFCSAFFLFSLLPNILAMGRYSLDVPLIFSIFSLLFSFLATLTYILLRVSDPGTVASPCLSTQEYQILLTNNKPRTLCFQCKIKRPPRSRHCATCKKCVKVFDHHCPWIHGCIGSDNCLLYVLCLAAATFYLLVNIAAHILRLAQVFDYQALSTSEVVHVSLACIAILVSLLLLAPLSYLLVRQLVQSGQGLTTFEVFMRSVSVKPDELNQFELVEKRRMVNQTLLSAGDGPQETPSKQVPSQSLPYKPATELSCWQQLALMFLHNRRLPSYA